jgi:phosphoadenosine phosphosulfate reductase
MPRDLGFVNELDRLNARFAGDAAGALACALGGALGPVALVSSFGADSAVLLHMAAQIDRAVPVLFIDTLMLFPETIAYHETLIAAFGLTNVQRIRPNAVAVFEQDPDLALHAGNPDACCALRKAQPLENALAPYAGWITGRKRFQSGTRASLPMFERDVTGKIKVNPLAGHSADDLRAYLDTNALPRHPLVARGYPSIGCAPCTSPVAEGEDPRAGRWRGQDKTECGIHVVDGRIVRGKAA